MLCSSCGAMVTEGSAFCPVCGTPTRDPTAATVALDVTAMEDPLLVKVREALAEHYVVEGELGRGGMAVVYRGREKGLEREVAIKVLPPETALQGSTADRFRREARLAASLEHPNIIPVYRVGEEQGLIYMAMKFVRGRALDGILEQQGALPVPIVLRVLTATAHGLAYAHEHQVVHRDIKGANVLIELDGRVLVSDFGIARALTETALTASGVIIGTPDFMSPEQCGGAKIGPQSDQYSLGVLAFQMLSGQLPFEADSIMQLIQHHYVTPPPDLRQVREGVPEELLSVVYRALGKKPEDRFPTTLEMAEALEAVPQTAEERRESLVILKQLVLGETIPKVRTSSLPPVSLTAALAAAPQDAATALTALRPAPTRRRGARAGLIAAAAVLVLGGAGALYQFVLRPQPEAGPATPAGAATGGTAVPPATQPAAGAPAPTSQPAADRAHPTDRPRQPQPQARQPSAPAGAAPQAPAAATGRLNIRTSPANASVTVDGIQWGLGGGMRSVPAGPHLVVVTLAGCEPITRNVTVQAGQSLPLSIPLTCQGQAP